MVIEEDFSVLHLVTAEEIFFKQQITTLENKGINCAVLEVPGANQIDGDMAEKRGMAEYLRYLPTVQRELRKREYDLVHANYGLTAPFAVTQRQLPVVLTLWGSDVIGFDGMVTKTFARWADAVTVRSEEMRQLIGLETAHIIPSGIDLDVFRPIDQELARNRVGWEQNELHVLFPYSPKYERKNFPLACNVVNQAEEQLNRSINLQTVVGVDHTEMPYYLNAADALILTSTHEGSPNTIKEALACNIPIVSTDVGDVRARLEGVSLVGVGSSQDNLTEILVDVLQSGQRSNGRDAVEHLSWDNIGDRFIDIYIELVE